MQMQVSIKNWVRPMRFCKPAWKSNSNFNGGKTYLMQ